jgi:hypothetical protein
VAPDWVKWLPSNPTSAHWYAVEDLWRLIAGHLNKDRGMTVRELVSTFSGLARTAKQKAVCVDAGLAHACLADLTKDNAPEMPVVAALLAAMKRHSRPVKPAALGVIGKGAIAARFAALGCEMETFKYAKVETTLARPLVTEAAFAWCPERARTLITGVNWSPGILNPFRQLGHQSLDAILAQQRVHHEEPVALLVHIACPRPNYSDRGKSSVVLAEPQPIINLVTKVTKTWAKQLKAEERHARHIERRHDALVRSRRRTIKEVAYEVMGSAYLKASTNDTLPAQSRQVMYAARPDVQDATGKALDDQYFCQVLLPNYITEYGREDWDVVFDARGHFTEPHTGLIVPLGTIDVRRYIRAIDDSRPPGIDIDIGLNGSVYLRSQESLQSGPVHRKGRVHAAVRQSAAGGALRHCDHEHQRHECHAGGHLRRPALGPARLRQIGVFHRGHPPAGHPAVSIWE